MVDAYVRKPYK